MTFKIGDVEVASTGLFASCFAEVERKDRDAKVLQEKLRVIMPVRRDPIVGQFIAKLRRI